ncbi:MAG: SIMPL domain-containing protein [Thermoanaerobaculaceae bacterium]|nr:SIMPL domain-containing protein [Thermoanaerobaculaceae bacterium]
MSAEKGSSVVLALGLCVGLIGGAAILGRSLQEIRKGERYVTVKGVAERDVKADLAVWGLKVRVAGNDLVEAGRSLEATRAKVLQFLSEKGFSAEEVSSQDLKVSDRQANDYGSGNTRDMLRYVVEATVLLRTRNVDLAQRVSRMTDELVRAGVVLSTKDDWQSAGPRFIFTQLNTIKPAMLAEATKSARAAAAQFAADSGSAVGSIRRASQGLFSITNRDQSAPGQGEGGGGSEDESDLNKRVRVVVTVDYVLKG